MRLLNNHTINSETSPENTLEAMLDIAFEIYTHPKVPDVLVNYDIPNGLLPPHVHESAVALNSLIFIADARFQLDNSQKKEDYHSWAGVVRSQYYRKNSQIQRIFSLEHAEMQDIFCREVKETVAEANPGLVLMGRDYGVAVARDEIVVPDSLELQKAREVNFPPSHSEDG